jgi:hypothetical protein
VVPDSSPNQQLEHANMRFPAWRVALTGGAITILVVAGIGVAAAAAGPAGTGGTAEIPAPAMPRTAAGNTDSADGLTTDLAVDVVRGDGLGATDGRALGRLLRAGRHLVHAEVTVTDRDGNLVHLQFDHGTVQSIGGGSLTIAEAGGGTVTVKTSDDTIVRIGRTRGDLGDVTVGAEVVVQSRVDGGVIARRILVIPTTTT